jgi:hypothetical protein
MDYRSAYNRRSRKGSRLKRRAAVFVLAGVAGCAALFALALRVAAPPAPGAQAQTAAATATLAPAVLRTAAQVEAQDKLKKTRRVYPYSIVPGGLANRQELQHAIVADKVVAVHYATFDAARATVETVRKARAVYVSYRKGDKVYWTAKRLHLAEGETLLSDGQNEIRGRCGNRISDTPRQPVEAKGPSEEELDAAVEVAQDGDGSVDQVALPAEENPAGGSYQLKTFATGSPAPTGGTAQTPGGTGPAIPGSSTSAIWGGGTLPVALDSKVSSDTVETGTSGTGTSGTTTSDPGSPGTPDPGGTSTGGSGTGDPGTGGTPTGGTATGGTSGTPGGTPPTTGTNPAPLPATLLPPTTDLPGKTNDPAKTPTKPVNVPEPGTPWLGVVGVVALLAARRAKKRARR